MFAGIILYAFTEGGLFIFYILLLTKIILIFGGSLVLLGTILYARNIQGAGIIILIGAIIGFNPISLLGGIIALVDGLKMKKSQNLEKKAALIRKAEKVLCDYLIENKGKAFSAVALHKRCIEYNILKLSPTEYSSIMILREWR